MIDEVEECSLFFSRLLFFFILFRSLVLFMLMLDFYLFSIS